MGVSSLRWGQPRLLDKANEVDDKLKKEEDKITETNMAGIVHGFKQEQPARTMLGLIQLMRFIEVWLNLNHPSQAPEEI